MGSAFDADVIMLSMCINAVAIILSVAGMLTPTTSTLVYNANLSRTALISALLNDKKIG